MMTCQRPVPKLGLLTPNRIPQPPKLPTLPAEDLMYYIESTSGWTLFSLSHSLQQCIWSSISSSLWKWAGGETLRTWSSSIYTTEVIFPVQWDPPQQIIAGSMHHPLQESLVQGKGVPGTLLRELGHGLVFFVSQLFLGSQASSTCPGNWTGACKSQQRGGRKVTKSWAWTGLYEQLALANPIAAHAPLHADCFSPPQLLFPGLVQLSNYLLGFLRSGGRG